MRSKSTICVFLLCILESGLSWTTTIFRSPGQAERRGRRSCFVAVGRSPPANGRSRLSTARRSTATLSIPRLTSNHLQQLKEKQYIVIPDFLPENLLDELRSDVQTLRSKNKFKVAKIGQDSTNTLNTDIRVAETVFLGPSKLQDVPSAAREQLYTVLDTVRQDLAIGLRTPLDSSLTEFLYAFYPQGGFYRRHRDAVPGSASTLRKYSLLLYLNDRSWDTEQDGGALRMHFDSGGDELPGDEDPNFEDVNPTGGTLILFKSDAIPHEVLDTLKERAAVVGWYNRPVRMTDVTELDEGSISPVRMVLLAFAAVLVTIGTLQLVN